MKVGTRLRASTDGQIGFVVETENGIAVRLDRRGENRVVPYSPQAWQVDREPDLTPLQVARICYGADRAFRMVHGEYQVADWIALKDDQRLPWRKGPPDGASEARRKLYLAVRMAVMS